MIQAFFTDPRAAFSVETGAGLMYSNSQAQSIRDCPQVHRGHMSALVFVFNNAVVG